MSEEYDGRQVVDIDLHRRRSVIVRMTEAGEKLGTVRIDNDPVALALEIAKAGPDPEVVLEATYGGSGDPINALVEYGSGVDVETVIIDGEVVVEKGRSTRINDEELFAQAQTGANRAWDNWAGRFDNIGQAGRLPHDGRLARWGRACAGHGGPVGCSPW